MDLGGRISGNALRALVAATKTAPVRNLAARFFRERLGIDALRALEDDEIGSLPSTCFPVRARSDRERAPVELSLEPSPGWPISARRLTTLYRRGELTPEQVVRRALAGARELATLRPSLGPLLTYDEERALSAARESQARYAKNAPLGPLDGVVIAVKEEVNLQGFPTRLGTACLPHVPATTDCVAIARLRDAGALIIGQTPMTEFGLSPLGGNIHRTMPRNPHDVGRLAGGSSTGSAVAVATGVVPVALGLDGGGSIRVPAALNGVFGLKPTFGRIPLVGHGLQGGTTLVHIGPIACSTFDLAAFVEATSGADPRDAASELGPPLGTGELTSALGRSVRGLRIGVCEQDWADAAPDVAEPGRQALRALEQAGAVLVPVELALTKHAAPMGFLTIGMETTSSLRTLKRKHLSEFGPDVQLSLLQIEAFKMDDYLEAQRARQELRRQVASVLGEVDVLAQPTTTRAAPAVSDSEERRGFVDPDALQAMCRYAFLGNLIGLPAGSAPVGKDKDGLPVGLEILGDAWDEASVLSVLAELERCGAAWVTRPPHSIDLLS